MAKDFGDDVIPLSFKSPEFCDLTFQPAKDIADWQSLLLSAQGLLYGLELHGLPGWGFGAGFEPKDLSVLIAYLPRTSPMARKWAADMQSAEYVLNGRSPVLRMNETVS